MTAPDLDRFIQVVGDYADQVAAAERQQNRDTMTVAHTLDEMYESRAWVDEWLAQHPRPKNGGSNRWQADSRNRFAQWVAWKAEDAGRRPILGRRTYQLLDGARIVRRLPNAHTVRIRTEYKLRPLKWMLVNRYEDRIPEVWRLAVEMAGGDPANVHSTHTRQALNEWKRKTFGARRDGTPRKSPAAITKAANAAGKANQLREQIKAELREMLRLASMNEKAADELRDLLDDLDAILDGKEADAA